MTSQTNSPGSSAPKQSPRAPKRAKWKRVGIGVGALLVSYLIVGNLLHRVVFALPAPDPDTYPRVGDRFGSRVEGVTQVISSVEDGWTHGELILAAGAKGPPMHYHRDFDEVITVTEGTLHLQLENEVVQLAAGRTYRVAAGVIHRPFNPTSSRVVIAGDSAIPQTFAACLVQLYAFLDERGGSEPGIDLLMKFSVIDPICDTHPAEPPGFVIAATSALLAPLARLVGYRNYDPARSLHPSGDPHQG